MSNSGLSSDSVVFHPWGWSVEVVSDPSSSPMFATGSGTVLIIDDEPMIQTVARAILTQAGYRVFLADNGQIGFQIVQDQADAIDLIILDLVMPGWSGHETFREIRKINDRIGVLFSSGYSSEVIDTEDSQGVLGFLKKPYRPNQLSEAVKFSLQEQARRRDLKSCNQ